AVLHPLGVVLDAAGVEKEAGTGGPPHLRRPDDHPGGDPGDGRGAVGGVAADDLLQRGEPGGVLLDEAAIDPASVKHDVQHAVEHADVPAGTDGDEEVGSPGDGGHARVEEDETTA